MRGFLVTLFLCLAAFETGADFRDGGYTIGNVLDTNKTPPQIENDIIKGESDSILKTTGSYSGSLRPGQLIMRRKVFTESYAFYQGILDTSAFSMRPPLYSIDIPRWARLEDMLRYRFYRSPSESIGSDEEIVYFDEKRLYTRFVSQLYYYRNGIWFPLSGSPGKPVGTISVESNPSGAAVFIDGSPTGKITPCHIEELIGGEYAVELRLPNYQFFRKHVSVIPDSLVRSSFELIADVDTVFITGDASYTLLLLPEPPVDIPYLIDDSLEVYSARIRLPSGTHRIQWHHKELYIPLDSTIAVPEGRVIYFDYLFKRRYGVVRIVPTPPDAEICIDQFGCGEGERIEELPVGLYRIDAYRQGFLKIRDDIHVLADTIITCKMDMRQVPDSDGDGFIDSVDQCPARYGLYQGCPRLRIATAIGGLFQEIGDFVHADSFGIGFSLLGIVAKTSTNQHFRNFISVYSSGKFGGINNYKGITFLNSAFMTFRGLFGYIELGQWSAGLRYQRSDSLALDSNHIVYFDSLFGVEPRLLIPSTAVALGFHYHRAWFDISYAIGHQWEDLIFEQVYNIERNEFTSIVFDNDWWFHQIDLEADFNYGDLFVPSLYFRIKFPFGGIRYTRWMVMNTGLQLKLFPHPVKKGS